MVQVRAALNLSLQGGAPTQEDCVLPAGESGIFAVADGFGGAVSGAEASRVACDGVRAFLEKEGGDRDATLPFVLRSYYSLAANVLFNAVVHANRRVLKANAARQGGQRGGTSLVAGYLDGELLALANVGACSAWLFRQGAGAELVSPRTYARLRDPLAYEPRPDHGAPLTALGISEDLEPEISEFRIQPGDWLLLHSDGLPASVRDSLRDLQIRPREPAQIFEEAKRRISDGVDFDNCSISLVIF